MRSFFFLYSFIWRKIVVVVALGGAQKNCWGDGDETDWHYFPERCCGNAPYGHPTCWQEGFSFELCCKGDPEITCESPFFERFRRAAMEWHHSGVLAHWFILACDSMVSNEDTLDYVMFTCAPAGLVALLHKLSSDEMLAPSAYAEPLSKFELYVTIAAKEKLLNEKHAEWPLPALMKDLKSRRMRIDEALDRAEKPMVDLVVCSCQEDLSWLNHIAVIEADEDLNNWYDTMYGFKNILRKRVNLRVFEKCGAFSQDAHKEEEEKITHEHQSLFRTVAVHHVFDAIRADDCTGYLSYLIGTYDRLPDYTFFLHADAMKHFPFDGFLMQHIVAAGLGVLDSGFVHLGSNYIEPSEYVHPSIVFAPEIFDRVWRAVFRSSLVPHRTTVTAYCCSNFVVRRDRILLRPRSFYQQAFAYFTSPLSYLDASLSPSLLGLEHILKEHVDERVPCQHMMYLWHVIFGEDLIYLRRQHQGGDLPLFSKILNVEEELFVDEAVKGYEPYI